MAYMPSSALESKNSKRANLDLVARGEGFGRCTPIREAIFVACLGATHGVYWLVLGP